MTFTVAERIKETSATTGTGTYTLAGAAAGCQAVSDIGANNYMPYVAYREDDTNWEVGIGRYLASPDRFERTTIIDSSNAGSAIDWGVGTTIIECAPPAWLGVPRVKSKSVAGSSNVTLTQEEQRCTQLTLTGTLTGNIEVLTDNTPWKWTVYNNTAGSFTVTFKATGGTGLVIPQGKRADVECDGTNIVAPTLSLVKVVSFQRDLTTASGNQTVTGVGFTPKAVIFIGSLAGGSERASFGVSDASTNGCVFHVTGAAFDVTSAALFFDQGSSNQASGSVSSFNSDGCVIAWTKINSPTDTATIKALFFG